MPVSDPSSRMVHGMRAPAVGRWTIDRAHARIGVVGRRIDLSRIHGRFTAVSGFVWIAEDPWESSAAVTIDTASIDTGSRDRDEKLRSVEHLDVLRHPTATFRSSQIERSHGGMIITGRLELAGATNDVELIGRYRGTATDAQGVDRSAFSARGVLNREDWGLTWNVTLPGGRLLIASSVVVEVDLEATRSAAGSHTGPAD